MISSQEAHKSLQTRLADRLHAPDEGRLAPYWLAIKISGHGFLLPLTQSGEIYPWIEPHRVPYTKDWFLGVANLRGSLCGVASLAKYLNLENLGGSTGRPITGSSAQTQSKRLVAFHPAFEMNTVLAIDQLAGLKSVDQMTPTSTVDLYADGDQQTWQQIDLGLLAQDPRFVSIAS
jgi:twitching motility protein PilI